MFPARVSRLILGAAAAGSPLCPGGGMQIALQLVATALAELRDQTKPYDFHLRDSSSCPARDPIMNRRPAATLGGANLGFFPATPRTPGRAGPPACPAVLLPGAPVLAAKAPPPLPPAHPEPLTPAPAGVRRPVGSGPVSLVPQPRPRQGGRGGALSPATPGCFGGCLQHLRSGLPRGRLTDRLDGCRCGRRSALGPAEPRRSRALPELRCAAPTAASRPPPSPRAHGLHGAAAPRGAERAPAPGRDVRGEKWLKGRAEGADAERHVRRGGRRGFGGGKMLYPPQSTRRFSAALQVEGGEPREGGPD